MSDALRWRATSPEVRARVEAWWRDDTDARANDAPVHRRVLRLERGGEALLVKHFRTASGAHALRERTKAALGVSPCAREWRGLGWLREAALPGPRPLGLARTAEGDELLVMQALDGDTLARALDDPSRDRRALLDTLAASVARLHACGIVHGDLHAENILIGASGPLFVDLQRARRVPHDSARRLRDLGLLDYSLRQHAVRRSERLRFLLRALGLADAPPSLRRARLRDAVVAAERASARQARARSRQGRGPAPGASWRF